MTKFERIQQHRHMLAPISENGCTSEKTDDQQIVVRYDRFTSRFEVIHQDKKLISQWLFCLPFKRFKFSIDHQDYEIVITWLVFWQSTLYRLTPSSTCYSKDNRLQTKMVKTKAVRTKVIKELLPRRRKKSQILMAYLLMMSLLKISFMI